MFKNYVKILNQPFRTENGLNIPLVLVFLVVNGIVLINAAIHDPRIGYDAYDHLYYFKVMSEFRIPGPADTREFFSPPLPYLIPALVYRLSFLAFHNEYLSLGVAAKFAQMVNVLLSILLTYFILKICDLIDRDNSRMKTISLFIIGSLPVYYKTFANVRGETMVALFYVIVIYLILKCLLQNIFRLKDSIVIGIMAGMLILSRQWGFFLFPALAIFIVAVSVKLGKKSLFYWKMNLIGGMIALVVGGWFYIHLNSNFGSGKAFNRSGEHRFSLSNQPLSFYFGTGNGRLFTDPLRKSFPNQLLPIFYSETWGDYWCLFNVYAEDLKNKKFVSGEYLEELVSEGTVPEGFTSNRFEINKYLGRVNLVSAFATILLLSGFILGLSDFIKLLTARTADRKIMSNSLIFLIIFSTIGGYLWFLIMYPNLGKGDTIKATYVLHAFPFLSILTAQLITKIRNKSLYGYVAIIWALSISWLHNAPVYITRYILNPFSL